MMILGIDSASAGCSACLWQDGQCIALAEEKMERGQDARLIPLVQEILHSADKTFADLDRIAVTRGPGSFTGIRIGLAAARGIGLAACKPVIGVDRLRLHRAQHAARDGNLMVVLESRRLELYVSMFTAQDREPAPIMLSPQEIVARLHADVALCVAGDARAHLQEFIDPARFLDLSEPEVQTACELAAEAQDNDVLYAPLPLYVRAPDVTLKANKDVCA